MFLSFGLLLSLLDVPFGIQVGSIVPYTAFVFLSTFGAGHGQQPYFFACPIVGEALRRLAWRHLGFLLAILVLETIALYLTRYLPSSLLAKSARDNSPFAITLCVLCGCIAFVQTLTNRSLLERAHHTRS
jgi:hypothetical protein